MTYGAGNDPGWQQQPWTENHYTPPQSPRSGSSGAMVALIAVLSVLVLILLGAVAYLFLRPGGPAGNSTPVGPSSAGSASLASPQPQVTVTATPTPTPPTVTVTQPGASPSISAPTAGFLAGADRSGWIANRQARCNASDSAAMIGMTNQASFSICINPDNGRYYYRGSADGLGVEVDDPIVSGSTARVSNNDVVYAIDATSMEIYRGGVMISSQPMVNFWVR